MSSTASTPCRLLLCGTLAALSAAALAKDGDAAARPSTITVIELPPPLAGLPGAGRERAHHALSIATDAPKPFLRGLGLDATDCSLRFRLPSRIKPRDTTSGVRLEVQAQAGLGCRF